MTDENDISRKENIKEYRSSNAPVKHSRFLGFFSKLLMVVIVVVSVVMIFYLRSENFDKMKKYDKIESQINDLKIKNEELELSLDSDDIGEYMEKLAVEKYGYAYPDEIRYYDTSHN